MRKLLLLLLAANLCATAFGQLEESPAKEPGLSQTDIVGIPDLSCDACKEPAVKFTFAAANSVTVYSNNILYYKQTFTIATNPVKLIKKIKTDLTYFEFLPETDDCFPCNKNAVTFGNWSNSTIAAQAGVGTGTHSLTWTFLPPKNPGSFAGVFNITLPPTVKCCPGTIRWCIRYVIEFDDCSVCSKTICYEKLKTTTTPVPPVNPTLQK